MIYRFNAIFAKISMLIFREIEKSFLKLIRIFERPPNSMKNSKREGQSWRTHTSWFQNLAQNYNNQNCGNGIKTENIDQWSRTGSPEVTLALAVKWFSKRGHDHSTGEKTGFQQIVQEKLDIHPQKNEVGTLPNTTHKNELKMDP